ncbi:MAG: hypothetical protein KC441_10810, partial [Anaerolineales bacterium]|nr:hypothetical protein [Anaerolineales bacterium]
EQLTEQFAAAEIAAMHLRASKWLAAQGYLEEAIDHALLGGDESAAVSILFAHGPLLVSEERWLLLERLLNKFRPEIINREPLLLLLLCWLSLARYYLARLESIRECIAAAEIGALEPEQKRFLDCSMHTFAAIGQNWAGNFERTVLHSRKALALIRPEWPVVAGYAWIHLGTAVHHLKGGEAALVALAEDEHLAVSSRDRIYKYIAVSFVDWLSGDLTKLFYTARNGLELMGGKDLLLSSGILHLMAGSACYERNELDTAAEHFTAVLDVKYGYRALPFMYCAIGQALVYLAQNMANEAWEVIETAVEFCLETEHSSLLLVGRAFQAELALRQGQTDKARQLIANLEGTFLSKLMPHPYQPQITLPKVWLFEETPASRQKAEAELRRLRSIVTETHNVPGQIRVLCLQALLCQSQNKMEAAEEALVQAVRLAQPGGFIRSFVDLGPLMAVLLKHLYLQGYAPVFIQQILEAFPSSRPAPNTTPPLLLIESLTDREMEVLNLLAQRLSNKEISKMLVISPETVKRHTSNIYQKLQVKNRRQAVAKAYSLNLLVDVA